MEGLRARAQVGGDPIKRERRNTFGGDERRNVEFVCRHVFEILVGLLRGDVWQDSESKNLKLRRNQSMIYIHISLAYICMLSAYIEQIKQ